MESDKSSVINMKWTLIPPRQEGYLNRGEEEALIGRPLREDLGEHDPPTEDVSLRVIHLMLDHLWAHVNIRPSLPCQMDGLLWATATR